MDRINLKNRQQKAADILRGRGYLTSGDIARRYRIHPDTAAIRMGEPCCRMVGKTGTRFWHGDRVVAVMGEGVGHESQLG